MAQLALSAADRDRYLERALERALANDEIARLASALDVELSALADVARTRREEIWTSVPEEEGHLAELLAERERLTEGPLVMGRPVARKAAPRRSPLDDRVGRVEEVLVTGLVEKGLLPILREELNRRLGQSEDLVLRVTEAPGLAEMVEPTSEIRTAAFDELERLIEQMPGGSIGIAGPRGAGKTTLIRAFCKSREVRGEASLAVELAAPVDYEPRDFVLHLFERLCVEVRGPALPQVPRSIPRRWLMPAFGIAAIVAGAAMVALALFELDPWWVAGAGLVCAGLVVLALQLLLGEAARAARIVQRGAAPAHALTEGVLNRADALLREIKFQQSFTHGWSGAIKLPAGFEMKGDSSTTLAERQQSFPDVVARLRDFIRELTATHVVVIGIDEMDKIASNEDAQRFLNDIKGIFGIPKCYYLVSISEDAMSNFERRGLPFRDAFDSSFDEVVHVAFFTLDDTTRFLGGRIVGLSLPFVCLCHCVAGGLPRDIIRVARDIVAYRDRPEHERRVDVVCRSLISAELAGKCEALTLAARTLSLEPPLSDFVRWAKTLRTLPVEPEPLLAHCGSYPDTLCRQAIDGSDGRETAEHVRLAAFGTELIGFVYFAATLLEFFAFPAVQANIRSAQDTKDEQRRVDALAEARQTFAINASVAWERVSAFRRAWGLRALDFAPALPVDRPARAANGRRRAQTARASAPSS